ncbi:MAG TPA: hypothetical protein VMU13_00085 [Candidatus Paceibacterota bacterium]|nr:hypothetical protein [Candidatus Paceibacterota bacterium]
MKKKSPRGFIALMSTIIITAILLAVMATVGMASFYARSDALASEEVHVARARATSCIDVTLLALATSTDPASYNPTDETIDVGDDKKGDTCVIESVVDTGTEITIRTHAQANNSFASISATVSLPPTLKIISWSELP